MPPNVQVLRGGAPVKNTILVNVDNETVFGDGSIENPLRAEPGGTPITAEAIEVPTSTVADPDVTVTFVTYAGLIPEIPTTISITLADGSVDGQQKQVGFQGATNITWRLTPANLDGATQADFPTDGPGGITLSWNADAGAWFASGLYNGTLS